MVRGASGILQGIHGGTRTGKKRRVFQVSDEPLPQFKSALVLGGKNYGHITIDPDGTFHGSIDRQTHSLLVELARNGFTEGMILTFAPVAATPGERPSGL